MQVAVDRCWQREDKEWFRASAQCLLFTCAAAAVYCTLTYTSTTQLHPVAHNSTITPKVAKYCVSEFCPSYGTPKEQYDQNMDQNCVKQSISDD